MFHEKDPLFDRADWLMLGCCIVGAVLACVVIVFALG